jgi:Fic family protein
VTVGPNGGVPAAQVPAALERFEAAARSVCAQLDLVIAAGALPEGDRELHAVLALCAALHGEWVRIHPFANGNGRTARMWGNWAALRYGLPPFVRLRPRPAGLAYAAAAHASMLGDHTLAIAVFRQQLTDLLDELRA